MAKSKLKPSLEDAFSIGKFEGIKEVLGEMEELIDTGLSKDALKSYVKARLKTLNNLQFSNPFKKEK